MVNRKKQPITVKQRLAGIVRVGKVSFAIAPTVLYLQIISALINAVLPIATAFFAAQTTTQLAAAYSGTAGAGEASIFYVILTAILAIATAAWNNVKEYIGSMARYKLESAMNDRLISHFLVLDFWRYDDKKTADLMDRSKRFSHLFSYLFENLASIFSNFVVLISTIIALGFVSVWLALVLFMAVLPGLYIQYRMSKARTAHWESNIETRRKMYDIQWQLTQLDSIAEIRLYGLAKHLLNMYRDSRDKDEKGQIQINRQFMRQEFLTTLIEAVAETGSLIYVTLSIIAHKLPVGHFLYVQQLISRGLGSTRSAAQTLLSIDEQLSNLSAYDEFMQLPVQAKGGHKITSPPQQISFNNVSFTYPQTNKPVLQNISLNIKNGQRIAIVGENGAGKSTLIKLLLGLYTPNSGDVFLDNIPTKTIDMSSWHNQLGVLQQEAMDFDYLTARENIIIGDVALPFSKKRYNAAIKTAEAEGFLNKLPKGDASYISKWIEHEDGTKGVELSGGQKQRLALARNLYRDSPIIILDEPTSAIDALAESRIFKHLFEQEDKTIITVSHRLSTVRRANQIYVMENGAIIEQGTHAELVKLGGAYVRLFESQL